MGVGQSQFPSAITGGARADTAAELLEAANDFYTTLTSGVDAAAATLNVATTTGAPASGVMKIDNEIVYYGAKTSNSLTGVLRGQEGTAAAIHAPGARVENIFTANYHAVLSDALRRTQARLLAVEAKLRTPLFSGTGQSTLAAGATQFIAPDSPGANNSFNATENLRRSVAPLGGKLKGFAVRTDSAQPGSGALILTYRVESTDTSLVITIPANAPAGKYYDPTHEATVADGDYVSIKGVNAATAASAIIGGIWSYIEY